MKAVKRYSLAVLTATMLLSLGACSGMSQQDANTVIGAGAKSANRNTNRLVTHQGFVPWCVAVNCLNAPKFHIKNLRKLP
jgi:hypothetical protein